MRTPVPKTNCNKREQGNWNAAIIPTWLFLHGFHSLPEYSGCVRSMNLKHSSLSEDRISDYVPAPPEGTQKDAWGMWEVVQKWKRPRRSNDKGGFGGFEAKDGSRERERERGEMEGQFQSGRTFTSAEPCRGAGSGMWIVPAPGRKSSPWGSPAWSAASPA